ncbi:MAG: aminodeoxychorismate/anthranilate synthase component II, partial [Saprospiraceae bacterium]|nr:aminodeoxychorismate/anthranilate synthase component II [Saprospiraceae bacterium]
SAFHITAVDDTGEIMAFQHKKHQIYAVQFHPESIMTDHGVEMLQNFFKL